MALQIQVNNTTFLIPESDDPCTLWVGYFSKLKKELGTENAKMVWLVTWKTNGAMSCLTNPSFNGWLQKNKLDVSNAATRTISDLSEIGGNFLGLGKNITKLLTVGVPVVIGAVIIGFLVLMNNSTKKADLSDLSMLTPVGRGIKLLGK